MRALLVGLTLLLALAAAADAQVRGRVVDARSGSAVADAIIRISGSGTAAVTASAQDGSYAFGSLPSGDYRLVVLHAGYDSAAVRFVVRSGGVTLDVPLVPRPVQMGSIRVDTERDATQTAHAAEAGRDTLAVALNGQRIGGIGPQSTSALGDLVLAQSAREPPPDQTPGRQPHALYIWGSSAERGRVLLDGATLNAPLHLGAILPPLDPELLSRAELRTGGISPRYDGGTTYIMDFGTRPVDRDAAHFRGELDLLVGRATLDAPLGASGGVLFGARRVNEEMVNLMLDRPFGYGYADALARADWRPGAAGRVTATALTTRERIRIPRDLGEDEASWQNRALSMSWRSAGLAGASANASFSRGTADLPLLSAPGGHLEARVDRYAAAAERRWHAGALGGSAGAEVEHLRFDRRSSADEDPVQPELGGPIACTDRLPCATAAATTLSLFGESVWQPATHVAARTGLRLGYEPSARRLHLLPRLAVSVVGDGSTSLTLSAGRFSQVTTGEGTALALQQGGTDLQPNAADVRQLSRTGSMHATQVELSVSHRRSRGSLAASAHLRHHEQGSGPLPPLSTPGADISWAYLADPALVTLGYSVAGRRSAGHDGIDYQHIAAAGVSAARGPLRLHASASYGRGMPLTSIVLERPLEPTPTWSPATELASLAPRAISDAGASGIIGDRAYLRLDALISGEWTLRHAGRELRLMPYAKLVNALSRREALFYFYEGTRGEPQPLAALPAIPVFGLRWDF